jgi:hypothetical protein
LLKDTVFCSKNLKRSAEKWSLVQTASTKKEKLTIHNTKRRRANSFFFLPCRSDKTTPGTERKAAREKTKPTVDETVAAASGGPSNNLLVDVARPNEARGENMNRSRA